MDNKCNQEIIDNFDNLPVCKKIFLTSDKDKIIAKCTVLTDGKKEFGVQNVPYFLNKGNRSGFNFVKWINRPVAGNGRK